MHKTKIGGESKVLYILSILHTIQASQENAFCLYHQGKSNGEFFLITSTQMSPSLYSKNFCILIVIHPSIHSSYGQERCYCFGPVVATTGLQVEQREGWAPTGANNMVEAPCTMSVT